MNRLTDRMRHELERLALLREDEIDTIDLPEQLDWRCAERSRFVQGGVQDRNYDVRSIANWFIKRLALTGTRVTNLSLNKIVYFAFERFLVERGVRLSKAKIEAWAHGPVFREVYHSLKEYGDAPIAKEITKFSVREKRLVPAMDEIDQSDEEFLEELAQTYGRLSAGQLVELSHRDNEPWASIWHYRGKTNPGMEISVETILQLAPKQRRFDAR